MGLYSKTRRMTTLFCTTIISITFVMLGLRLTVFSDMASVAPAESSESVSSLEGGEITGEGDFLYKLASKIYFPKADARADIRNEALVVNPEGNKYLLNINIMLPETKDSLYYTGNITPGTSIDSAKLSAAGQKLKNGVYPCVAEISAVDPDTMTKVASEQREVTIYIGERPPA